jgi:hypothetical protein
MVLEKAIFCIPLSNEKKYSIIFIFTSKSIYFEIPSNISIIIKLIYLSDGYFLILSKVYKI